MKITGILTLNNGLVNKNGHIYPKEVFDKAIGEYLKKENIKNRKLKLEKLNEKIKEAKKKDR